MYQPPRLLVVIAAAMIGSLHAEPEGKPDSAMITSEIGQLTLTPEAEWSLRTKRIGECMDRFIGTREIAGAVTLVADGKKILHLSATGMADIEKSKPMATDSVFWIASMTKPITATAVMMMQDEGKLSVDDPVSKYLPEFRSLQPAAPFGKNTEITIKQCLTHSSGLAELDPDQTRGVTTLADAVRQIPDKPLVFEPGSKWQYCQSGINTVARIVEVVSGKAFPEFLQERLFGPLGMKDSTFYPGENQATRTACSYERTNDGNLKKADLPFFSKNPFTGEKFYPRANGGLFSTAEDYAKFAQMILNGGESGGKRYLKAETVKQMTTVQSGDLVTGFTPGNAWGLGWCVVREPQGVTAALSSGTFGHGGLFGTQAWIDPVKKRIYLQLIQRANFTNQGGSDASEVRREFQNAATQ